MVEENVMIKNTLIKLLTIFGIVVCGLIAVPGFLGAQAQGDSSHVALFSVPQGQFASGSAALLAQNAAVCSKLQIMFLVDQSGSMSGSGTSTVNDPQGLRFSGPEAAVDLLNDLHARVFPKAEILISIVHFGTTPELEMDWTPITSTNDADAQALKAQLQPYFKPRSTLGETNMVRAFQYVASMFNKVPEPVNDCPVRAVILLTDGQPDIEVRGFNVGGHMKELETYLRRYMPIPPLRLYVIAMNDKATKSSYWGQMESYWLNIAGVQDRIGLVENQPEIGKRFKQIIDELIAPFDKGVLFGPNSVCPGEVAIPPYLQWISFTLYKDINLNDHLEVYDPLGLVDSSRQDVKISVAGYNGAIETVKIELPQPGLWQLKTSLQHAACDLEVRGIKPEIRLISPVGVNPLLVQYVQSKIQFQVVDVNGVPLPDYKDQRYQLALKAELLNNGARQPLTLTISPGQIYSNDFAPVTPGTYVLLVSASSKDLDGKDVEVFSDINAGQFIVEPLDLELAAGMAGSPQPQNLPMPITVTVVSASGAPVQLNYPVEASAEINASGAKSPLTFTVDPNGAGYISSFTPSASGTHQLTYRAFLTLLDGSKVLIAEKTQNFDVYSTTLLNTRLVGPAMQLAVATDWLGQPADFSSGIELVNDQSGEPVSPDMVFLGNSPDVYKLTVKDADGKDVSQRFFTRRAAQTGRFEIVAQKVGPGKYDVIIEPSAALKQSFLWKEQRWSYTVIASLNPVLYALAAGTALIILVVVLCLISMFRLRPHPARGTVYICENVSYYDDDAQAAGADRRTLFTMYLGNKNRYVYTRGLYWDFPCPIPRLGKGGLPPLIRKIEVICPTREDSESWRILLRIWPTNLRRGETPVEIPLRRGQTDVRLNIAGYVVDKDPGSEY